MIYAVSFDGTISLGKFSKLGPPNESLIKHLIFRQKLGDKIILWTCREGKRLEEAVEFCNEYGLRFDAVNDNLPEIVAKSGVNSRKVICDVYIDDRAKNFDDYELTGEIDMDKIENALVRYADRVSIAG